MTKIDLNDMETLSGGRCRWWKLLAGIAGFGLAPLTGGASAAVGTALGISTCL